MNPTTIQFPALPYRDQSTVDGVGLARVAREHESSSCHEFPSCNYISVKEAARRLNRSPNTIYRVNRTGGPFPIVKDGRRVWVEEAGFEAFIATRQDELAQLNSELQTAQSIDETQNSSGLEVQHERVMEGIVPVAATMLLTGVVAWIGLRISYSETDPRKAASSMPNKHNASRRHHIPCMTASALSRQFLRPLAVKIA